MVDVFAFMKPDAVLRRAVGARILKELRVDPLIEISSCEIKSVPPHLVDQHYAHLVKRPFYPWLMHYSTANPVFAIILSGESGVIEHLRDVLGDTMAHKAAEGTIRNKYGIYSGINCLHASDSIESAEREFEIWDNAVGLQKGKFDIDIEEYIRANVNSAPIYTNELRDLCLVMHERGKSEGLIAQLHGLLVAECVGATDQQISDLEQIVLGAI